MLANAATMMSKTYPVEFPLLPCEEELQTLTVSSRLLKSPQHIIHPAAFLQLFLTKCPPIAFSFSTRSVAEHGANANTAIHTNIESKQWRPK